MGAVIEEDVHDANLEVGSRSGILAAVAKGTGSQHPKSYNKVKPECNPQLIIAVRNLSVWR